jgi:hypothetical protein
VLCGAAPAAGLVLLLVAMDVAEGSTMLLDITVGRAIETRSTKNKIAGMEI